MCLDCSSCCVTTCTATCASLESASCCFRIQEPTEKSQILDVLKADPVLSGFLSLFKGE